MDRHEVLERALADRAVAVDADRAPRDGARDVEVRDDVEAVPRAGRDERVVTTQGVGGEAGFAG